MQDRRQSQAHSRHTKDGAVIDNPLAHFTDEELQEDVRNFIDTSLPSVKYEALLRAARVAKDIRFYDEVARSNGFNGGRNLTVHLTKEEKLALRKERDVPFSEKGMRVVIATVSLAALLQGFVQSSFNGATLYQKEWGLPDPVGNAANDDNDWRLGAANASPWFFAAFIGCPLSLPVNYWFGRRGGIGIAALLILASSIGAIFARSWAVLFGIRAVNGIGMGIKAVSTPILASESAVGFWRGSTILAWQLWVAFGIMLSFAFNLLFTVSGDDRTILSLIQGSPSIPSLALLVMVFKYCPESPRYHLMKGPNYSPTKAFEILRRVRNTELQALRDMYVVSKALQQEHIGVEDLDSPATRSPGFRWAMWDFFRQFGQLFRRRRLINAVISTSTVNLSQQLCGVNLLAFYSGVIFSSAGTTSVRVAMGYSLGFGAINFFFALPAIKSIDTIGRRKWLLSTLPLMAVFMLGAALAFLIKEASVRTGVVAMFLFLFSVVYSPGLGPIPFTLASESFPLSHREAGTAWGISINLLFAGLLSMFFPSIQTALGNVGALGLFSGLNVVAFVLVFLLVEETKRRSLEELDLIFAVSKWEFMRFQLQSYLPWWFSTYMFGDDYPKPELYEDLVWGSGEGEDLSAWRGGIWDIQERNTEPVEIGESHPQVEPPQMVELPVLQPYTMSATNNGGPVSNSWSWRG